MIGCILFFQHFMPNGFYLLHLLFVKTNKVNGCGWYVLRKSWSTSLAALLKILIKDSHCFTIRRIIKVASNEKWKRSSICSFLNFIDLQYPVGFTFYI